MKVFISWSGDTSRQVAEALRGWLPSVIQAIVPYVSSEDIDKGARWSADISLELEDSNYGILCVTKENLGAPWLNFEAGALSKSFDKSRVSPFLFRIDRTEVTGPLLQFQSTLYEKVDVHKLIRSINNSCEPGLDEARLDPIFEVWWPSLEQKLDSITEPIASDSASRGHKRSKDDVLEEILTLVRTQQKLLAEQNEITPMLAHLLRINSAEHSISPSLVQELVSTWRILYNEVIAFVSSLTDESQSRHLLSFAEQLDVVISIMNDRHPSDPRLRDKNRRMRLSRGQPGGRDTQSGA